MKAGIQNLFRSVIRPLSLAACMLASSGGSAAAQNVNRIGAEMSRELRKVEKELLDTKPASPAKDHSIEEPPFDPAESLRGEGSETDETVPARPSQGGMEIRKVEIQGDVDFLEELELKEYLIAEVLGRHVTQRTLTSVARKYTKLVYEKGYYLAVIRAGLPDEHQGKAVYIVDKGRIGKVSFYQRKRTGEREPFAERFFNTDQLKLRMDKLQEGETFAYNEVYNSMFLINSHPDLAMNVDLKVRQDRDTAERRRYVDMDLIIDESLPLHGVLEIRNSGTDITEEWRAGLTLQHLNLTKRDDVLTVNIPVSIDLETIRSVAGSYNLPFRAGKGGAFTLFGGYSELDSMDFEADFDLDGEGWFVGVQGSYTLIATDHHLWQASIDLTHRSIQDSTTFGMDNVVIRDTKVDLSPFSIVLKYSSVKPDAIGGRNFLSSQTVVHFGDFLGSSGNDDFSDPINGQRLGADSDFIVERLQVARLQPVFGGQSDSDETSQQWIIQAKLNAQIADGPLISSEQMSVGGLDNVRGYLDGEVIGDYGVYATLELRSPVLSSAYTTRHLFGSKDRDSAIGERLQVVAFLDGAYVTNDDAALVDGLDDEATLLSAGLGLRVAWTSHSQLKFDWGFPIEETRDSDASGRGHASFQFQF